MKKILLACGAGASSGFIAQQMRKAAKKQKIDVKVSAVSDTEILENIEGVSVLFLGPHLAHKLSEIKDSLGDNSIEVLLIDKNHYASLDGAGVLAKAMNYL
ncbi:PTS lactose transporter subunit IIB [Shouchella clausii]|uniref:PTS sugar transporter subunit IIB n=1 Tax=Shouchella tritolerans TaxID=2979466 RepID=UPI000787AB3D|nr:PTS sugar transporter subunit IIB [Shouchella tritolerans]GIN12821.1 PTS lactose transporter subunit IIB [Shouchella clausii]